MKKFGWKLTICLVPLLISAYVVGVAFWNYFHGKGGFKLGVDLVGGTILIYEVDVNKFPNATLPKDWNPQQLATRLKSRIDPGDIFNISVRVASDTRFEIILPTGGAHQVEAQEAAWKQLLQEVQKEFPFDKYRDSSVGDVTQLVAMIQDRHPEVDSKELRKFIEENFTPSKADDAQQRAEEDKRAWREMEAKLYEKYPAEGHPLQYNVPLGKTIQLLALVSAQHANQPDPEAAAEAINAIKEEIEGKYKTEVAPKKTKEEREKAWKKLLADVSKKYPPNHYEVGRGRTVELGNQVAAYYEGATDLKAIAALVKPLTAKKGKRGQNLTMEEVQERKELISQVGSLEFRMFANNDNDSEAIKAAGEYFDKSKGDTEAAAQIRTELKNRNYKGQPPPKPISSDGSEIFTTPLGRFTYSWVELGVNYRNEEGLANPRDPKTGALIPYPPEDPKEADYQQKLNEWNEKYKKTWDEVLANRFYKGRGNERIPIGKNFEDAQQARIHGTGIVPNWKGTLLYSRLVNNPARLPPADQDKTVEYFVLTRDAKVGDQLVTGNELSNAAPGFEGDVNFTLKPDGAAKFFEFTKDNKSHLMSIVLDGYIESAATIQSAISSSGRITGNFTNDKINQLVKILRSGALPATLKSEPVSESTMGPTLGADTIKWGTISVGVAFGTVLLFMLFYYRFAGLVACIALLANLLLTVAFMVMIDATFTLPGLAGLVLMLGMAVDANVLIYERLREERERGASLTLAIRNGYDRALPTIIDTHLSSIFTAIVLYIVGNDQLKGFGISLTVGLIISLFTSLYMTRFMFDFWQAKGWLTKLSMYQGLTNFLHRHYIDFMRIRYYWFTATVILTIVGAAVFIIHLPSPQGKDQGGWTCLNIDFTGGTAYSAELTRPVDIDELRRELNKSGLPDLSVEQIFISAPGYTEGDKSKLFTVRTSEKDLPEVQKKINESLGENGAKLLKKVYLSDYKIDSDNKEVYLTFTEKKDGKEIPAFASRAQVSMLLGKELRSLAGTLKEDGEETRPKALEAAAQGFSIEGLGQENEGRFRWMVLKLLDPIQYRADLEKALSATQKAFADSPQPERLEVFDSQLAEDTQLRALYAIVASWGAILLYLWFRFGSWTFGLATVLCLIHDLFFTLGIIAFCHYIYTGAPTLAHALMIQDFKIDLPTVAALLTLVGYSVNDTIVVFDRIREVRGKNPALTPQMINDSVNQTLSRTILASLSVWLVVFVLYVIGGEGVHLFGFVMVVGVIVGTYSSIYIASPLLLIFGEGKTAAGTAAQRDRAPQPTATQP
jgi:SecD/SecF fusion protein